jgi:hypothetical protein
LVHPGLIWNGCYTFVRTLWGQSPGAHIAAEMEVNLRQ